MSELRRKWNDFSEKRITESLRKNETNAWDLVPRSIIDGVEKEIKLYRKLSEINDKIERIASDVCFYYGETNRKYDEFKRTNDDSVMFYFTEEDISNADVFNPRSNSFYKAKHIGKLARQKQSELNELIKQKQKLMKENKLYFNIVERKKL